MKPTQPPCQWVRCSFFFGGGETVVTCCWPLPSSATVRNNWSYTSACLIYLHCLDRNKFYLYRMFGVNSVRSLMIPKKCWYATTLNHWHTQMGGHPGCSQPPPTQWNLKTYFVYTIISNALRDLHFAPRSATEIGWWLTRCNTGHCNLRISRYLF